MGNLNAARLALEGLSIGDGFGDGFFGFSTLDRIIRRTLPDAPWLYTDDTNMALSIYEILRIYGTIEPQMLAQSFADHFDPSRKYGSAMYGLMRQFAAGEPWTVAGRLFEGQGSYGNGAAMRIAPLGAYFADDLDAVVEQAHRASIVTHTHPEGSAGAIAVAVGAAYATRLHGQPAPTRQDFLQMVLPHVPVSEVRSKIQHAIDIQSSEAHHAAAMLGNGSMISAQDTVPFVLWCAASSLSDFEEALWKTVSGFGDMDTTCAMVGGIIAPYVGEAGLPHAWQQSREALPEWALGS